MELAQDRVQWQALVLAVLNLRVLLPAKKRQRWISACASLSTITWRRIY